MDPSAARYLEALTAEVTAVLGGRVVGVYAHGSLLLGGYLPTRSDIDVLVVVEDPLSPDEQADLAARLSADALPCPAVGLELSVVLRSVAAAPTARPRSSCTSPPRRAIARSSTGTATPATWTSSSTSRSATPSATPR